MTDTTTRRIEPADVVLRRSDPLDVPTALAIGRGTLRKMRQNLGWAVGYNAIALPIAAGVFEPAFDLVLRPEIAAISMSGSSFLVAVNALLLKRLRLPRGDFEGPVLPPPARNEEIRAEAPRLASQEESSPAAAPSPLAARGRAVSGLRSGELIHRVVRSRVFAPCLRHHRLRRCPLRTSHGPHPGVAAAIATGGEAARSVRRNANSIRASAPTPTPVGAERSR